MNQRKKSMILAWVAVITIGVANVALVSAETIKAKEVKLVVKTNQAVVKSSLKVKISQEHATKIALKAHRGARVLSVKLQKNIYLIRLRTLKGKHLVMVGAYTGKILQDKNEGNK